MDGFLATKENIEIRNVWMDNIEAEFEIINRVIKDHSHISLDVEYPDVYYSPKIELGETRDSYRVIRDNVEQLKPIQFGLVFCNYRGYPTYNIETMKYIVWQVNLSDFDVNVDVQNSVSISFLGKQGMNFEEIRNRGVGGRTFGRYMLQTLYRTHVMAWSTFHGHYDLAYLLKTIRPWAPLPADISSFLELLDIYYIKRFDEKCMMRLIRDPPLYGGLEGLISRLGIERVGDAALCTSLAFFELRKMPGYTQYANMIFGLH